MSDEELAMSINRDWNKEFCPPFSYIYVYPSLSEFAMVTSFPGGYPKDFGPATLQGLRLLLENMAFEACQYMECRVPAKRIR
jgi:hypothetical protein